jgi:hypothetical protein
MAVGRKTGGRKKGSKNKRTVALEAALESTREAIGLYLGTTGDDVDAHGLLMAVYRDRDMPIDLRVEAAGKSLPFEKPRLASVDLASKGDKPLVVVLRDF